MVSINHYHRDDNEYSLILDFIKKINNINYKQFDHHIINDISLFNIPSDAYFSAIEKRLHVILNALPSIKRIFSRPCVYLKDKYEIAPVEAVRVVNNNTLSHVSYHTELWDNITSEGIKPRKLLTIEKKENYEIYENIIFTRVIRSVLSYLDEILVLIKDLLYDCQDLNFNILDRTHHKLYFLALGKLHIEYVLAYERHFTRFSDFIETLLFIEKTIKQRLKTDVYKKCIKNKSKLKLKKTNIFRNHRDYKNVYDLAKKLDLQISDENFNYISHEISKEEYASYINVLLIFSIGHFNFSFDENDKLDLLDLDSKCSYLDWSLSIKNIYDEVFTSTLLSFNKNKEYSICLIYDNFIHNSEKVIEDFKARVKADEYFFVSTEGYGKEENLYISIYDIDSFRRIQQVLLKGMIYSDEKFEVCPFCGNKLTYSNESYNCSVCRGSILKKKCKESNHEYYATVINNDLLSKKNKELLKKYTHLNDRFNEARYHYRNITKITNDGKIICPKCNKVHE